MSREEQIIDLVKATIARASADLHGYKCILFGSRARGTASKRSDFDIGIVGPHPLPLSTYYKIADMLDQIPTLYMIDWVDLERVDSSFKKTALMNAKVIYG
jgi:predicted nucleotidyltransferase